MPRCTVLSAFEFYLTVMNACSVWVLISSQVLCSVCPLLQLFWEVAGCQCAQCLLGKVCLVIANIALE